MVDLAGTTGATLNLALVRVMNFCTPRRDQPISGFYSLPPGLGKPPPSLYLRGRRFCPQGQTTSSPAVAPPPAKAQS